MKPKARKAAIIASFSLFALLMYLLSAVRISAFDENMYRGFFKANNIYDELPDSDARIDNLLGYLKGGNELNSTFFNEKESLHMKDVKGLFSLSAVVLFISMAFCLAIIICIFIKKDIILLANCLLYGGAISLGFIIILALLATNFQWLFEKFHLLLFSNDLWLMDPAFDKIIVLLPESFFRLAARRIFLTTGMLSFGMLTAGLLVKYMEKKMHGVLQ